MSRRHLRKRVSQLSEAEKAEKRERDREAKHRKTLQGRFESNLLHLDAQPNDDTESGEDDDMDDPKSSWLSDNADGVEAIVNNIDGWPVSGLLPSEYEKKKRAAVKRLSRAHKELVDVFLLILKNGSNRKESIHCLMKKKAKCSGTPKAKKSGLSTTSPRGHILDT